MINYLIITWSFQIYSVAVRIKGKHTKRQKKRKKKQQQQKKTLGTVEAWTRTTCMTRYLPDHWATEDDTQDRVINIIFKAFSSGFLPVKVVSCWLKNKQSLSWT